MDAAVKTILIIAMSVLMALPFITEYISFRRDRKKKITYKRFRTVIYTFIYFVLVTVALVIFRDIKDIIGGLSFVQYISGKLALSSRTVYCGRLISVVLINFAAGFLFGFFGKFVRIGMKKRSLLLPKKKNGEFSLMQKAEKKAVLFFHKEIWFFTAEILKYLSIVLSSAYLIIFILFMIPAAFSASWLRFDIILKIFNAVYLYPVLTLLPLWQTYFFLEGVKLVEKECPELLAEEKTELKKTETDLDTVDRGVKKLFADYFVSDVDLSEELHQELSSASHNKITEFIARAAENDIRNPQPRQEVYLDCLDRITESSSGVIINGNFFSGFSMYFLRYLSVTVARGDNVIFICNSDSETDTVYNYIVQGLSEISSLCCDGFSFGENDFDEPLWRVIRISGEKNDIEEASLGMNNILVTTLSYLCSSRFETEYSRFVPFVDAVVFTDTLKTVNTFNRQLAILSTRLKHLTKKNALAAGNGNGEDNCALRYISRQVRYICFDDTRTPGLDKVLKNMLDIDFISADSMKYNGKTLVRCFRFEGRQNENGEIVCPQLISSSEQVGVIMNTALLCLTKGAKQVHIFTDDIIPYENIKESMSANMGKFSIKTDSEKICINKRCYNPGDYSVIIAMDSGDNLPSAVRRYVSSVSEKSTLVIVFSRPYMMRDYYLDNIDSIWSRMQSGRIPVEMNTEKDIAQKILIKASAGGISRAEVLSLAGFVPSFGEYVRNEDINSILRRVLGVYGKTGVDNNGLFRYFEYTSSHSFDQDGKYNSEVKIILRRQGELFEYINGRNMIKLVSDENQYTLPMPASRLTQNYIAGQNFVFRGNIYSIRKTDTEKGLIHARLATSGLNSEPYKYIQDRLYSVELSPEKTVNIYPGKHVIAKGEKDGVRVSKVHISVIRTPMDVVTRGYYVVDPHTLSPYIPKKQYYSICDGNDDSLAVSTYRRYGDMEKPWFSSDRVMKSCSINADENGALMMCLEFTGEFGPDKDKTALLLSVMLNEIIKNMFPSVADSVAVCPVLSKKDETSLCCSLPEIRISGSSLPDKDSLSLFIIEDCATDLGVVSVLMSAGDDILSTLFSPVYKYLSWYNESTEKSTYLYFGEKEEPSCYDFSSVYKLSSILGDSKYSLEYIDIDSVIEYDKCDFCGRRFAKGDDIAELPDGRRMCRCCSENIADNGRKALENQLENAKLYIENTYGIRLDEEYEVCFESTVKISNSLKQRADFRRRGSDIPLKSYIDGKNRIHAETSIPEVNLSELLVRELTHTWQIKNLPELDETLAEGHIALVSVQYLTFLGETAPAKVRKNYYESTSDSSGEGYRLLVKELLSLPAFCNNPFRYLLEKDGGDFENKIIPPVKINIEEGDYGKSYASEIRDRAAEGRLTYFHFSRLPDALRQVYMLLAEAVTGFEEVITVNCSFEEMERVSLALLYDRPDLFWYRSFSMSGSTVNIIYGAGRQETEELKKQVEIAAAEYLEGITPSMSAYDAALRIHTRIISAVDYDTKALEEQKKEGGPKRDEIDYLRNICGVFLKRAAVCEGYARAVQYLLQKCGIECAEVTGDIKEGNGGGHAWNILKIDGEYYFMDTTWDDSSNTVCSVKNNTVGFDYFCVTTEEIKRTRDIDSNVSEIPLCDSIKANYYYHNGLLFDEYEPDRIKELAAAAAAGKKKFFTFKMKSEAAFSCLMKNLSAAGKGRQELMKAASKADSRIESYLFSTDKNMRTFTAAFIYKKKGK